VRDVELGLTDDRERRDRARNASLVPAESLAAAQAASTKAAPVSGTAETYGPGTGRMKPGSSLLEALEAATTGFAIDDATAERLGAAAADAPASGSLVQVPASSKRRAEDDDEGAAASPPKRRDKSKQKKKKSRKAV